MSSRMVFAYIAAITSGVLVTQMSEGLPVFEKMFLYVSIILAYLAGAAVGMEVSKQSEKGKK